MAGSIREHVNINGLTSDLRDQLPQLVRPAAAEPVRWTY